MGKGSSGLKVKRDKWQHSFSEWFQDINSGAGIVDYRYPIKGCGVWLPYGFKLRKNIIDVIRGLLDESGHEETLFPIMITSDMMEKEAVHIGSFQDQIFWVTHAGKHKLDDNLALRPTSEAAIAPMLKLWIRSHADLPKKIYQVVSIFRYETKATKPLIRVREVTTFKEAHTSHATPEEAEEQVKLAVKLYSNFFDELSLPYIISKRPEWDKFAGSTYSIAHDIIMPDGRALQIGTSHNLGQSFSKAFDITFELEDGSRKHIWQTSYGISERVIAAVVAIHGDDGGLVLPPKVAPTQVVIVPIPYKDSEELIVGKCKDVGDALRRRGIRVEVDLRMKLTPGAKFYEWEMKGVPLRIEIGPRDLEKGQVTMVRRDNGEKTQANFDVIVEEVQRSLDNISLALKKRASDWMKNRIHSAKSVEEIKVRGEENNLGVVETVWCGNEDCGLKMEEITGLKVLGTALEQKPVEGSKCVSCGKAANHIIRLARTY
jgi:prolyl-tRNA synthetase